MKKIPLSQGLFALVDDEDYELVAGYIWYAARSNATWYASTNTENPGNGNGNYRKLHMHSLILKTAKGYMPDHIDGDGLDNRRENLRPVTYSQNAANSRKRVGCASAFKGVGRLKAGYWVARIIYNYKEIYLGAYKQERAAALAYDLAAQALHGKHARVNFVGDVELPHGERAAFNKKIARHWHKVETAITKSDSP